MFIFHQESPPIQSRLNNYKNTHSFKSHTPIQGNAKLFFEKVEIPLKNSTDRFQYMT